MKRTVTSFLRYGCVLLCALGASGCLTIYETAVQRTLGTRSPLGVRIVHVREGSPLPVEGFASLEAGRSTLADVLEAVGAPRTLRRTDTEEILEYYYFYDRQTHLIVKPVFFDSYGSAASYNFYGLEDGLNSFVLVLDHEGLLKRKEYRLTAPGTSAGAILKTVFVP